MKLIFKLTLGFVAIALIVAVDGYIQVSQFTEIQHDLKEVEQSNIGEFRNAVDSAYRIAIVDASVGESLLTALNGKESQAEEAQRNALAGLTHLAQSLAKLKRATEKGASLAEDEEGEVEG